MMTSIPELSILKYLLDVKNYHKYRRYIVISKEYRELTQLYHTLDALHERFPEIETKSVDELEAYVAVCYPNLSKGEQTALGELCEQIKGSEVSEEVSKTLLESIRHRASARALALAAFEVSEGRGDASNLRNLLDDTYQVQQTGFTANFVTNDLREVLADTIDSPGLHWPLDCLNVSLGPLRRGDFGFVFARPETGKTTFIAHAITHMAEQCERPIVWFNNEEQGKKVRGRTFQAALGCTTGHLKENVDECQKQYDDRTRSLIRIYDDASIHRRDVEAVVESINPELLVFDQIDKIRGFDADRPDLVFGRIYQWARELAKKHCPVIGTCQADGTGEGVKWLTMGHVAEAKTSKQAEADWILGIGRSNEAGTEDVRYFNISKNKLMGAASTDPELRHGRFDVYIRPNIARYQDIV